VPRDRTSELVVLLLSPVVVLLAAAARQPRRGPSDGLVVQLSNRPCDGQAIIGSRCCSRTCDLRITEAFDTQDYGFTRGLRSRPAAAVTGTTADPS